MLIISHRGIGFNLPENSLESFEETLKQGFSLEIDVQKTKDDKLVIIHDSNLKRLRNIDKNVSELDENEAKKFNLAGFAEVLKIFKQYGKGVLAIHIKDESQENILELVALEIKKADILDSCFVFDLTIEGMKKIKKIDKRIRAGFSVGEKRFSKTIYLWEDVKNENFDIVWWDEWNSGLYNKKNLDEIKKSDKKVYAIAPDLHHIHNHPLSRGRKKEGWIDLINLKVDGICTDYPKEIRKVVKNGYNHLDNK